MLVVVKWYSKYEVWQGALLLGEFRYQLDANRFAVAMVFDGMACSARLRSGKVISG